MTNKSSDDTNDDDNSSSDEDSSNDSDNDDNENERGRTRQRNGDDELFGGELVLKNLKDDDSDVLRRLFLRR